MCCCQNFCFCCCCRTTALLFLVGATTLFLLFTLHPAFSVDEDVIDFGSQSEEFRNNAMGAASARANHMVDRLIQLMRSSALISPQLNNITVERTLDLRHGTIEDLNIQGLVAGMKRSGDALLTVSGARFGLAMPISLTNVTVRALHRRSSPVGALQAAAVAHLDVLTTRFQVSLGAKGMNLDDFKITSIGRIRMKQLEFMPGLDWFFSWLSETQINQRRAELVGPLEEAGTRVFQKALKTVTQDKIAEFIAEKTNRLRMLG